MSLEQIFPRPGGDFLALLAGLPKHLDAAMPMRRQHRRELPGDIRHLSHLLTDERGDLRRDYLSDPAALSAYMRYFLPWNIYRLGVLFNGLALDPGGDNPDETTTIVDLGTGPLTTPLALWMARPHLRRRKLHFICVDRAQRPMRLGLDTLAHMAEAQGGTEGLKPWRVTLVKAPLDARLREKADLLVVANALNEVLHRGEGDLLEDAGALAGHLASSLTPTGQLLVVEPGIRPSAHLLSALRRGLMHRGLKPLAPCPHTEPCPMSGRGYTAWCHFNFDADAAPGWLKKLSEDARLTKENVSLSFLQFSAKGRKLEAGVGKSLVRAVSGPFDLPGADGTRRYGQYCCSDRGLTLLSLPRKHLVPLPGMLIEAAWPETPITDAKSGALVLPLGHGPGAVPASRRGTRPDDIDDDDDWDDELDPALDVELGIDRSKLPPEAQAGARPRGKATAKPGRKPPRLPSERPAERAPKPRKPKAAKQAPEAMDAAKDAKAPRAVRRARAHAEDSTRPKADPAVIPAGIPADILDVDNYPDERFEESTGQQPVGIPSRRPGKKKPGRPPVKKVNAPKSAKGGKSAPKADSRAARKAKKQKAK